MHRIARVLTLLGVKGYCVQHYATYGGDNRNSSDIDADSDSDPFIHSRVAGEARISTEKSEILRRMREFRFCLLPLPS